MGWQALSVKGDALLRAVAGVLSDMPWKLVCLGGITTHLHLTDRAAPEPDLTDDVDVVIEVTSPVEFHTRVREKCANWVPKKIPPRTRHSVGEYSRASRWT
jgi:hypothetical protein